MTDTRDFFISFTKADWSIASALNEALRNAGFTTWFHPADKPKGAGIADWMEVALDASTQMLALCSDSYFDREKGYCRAERQSMFWADPTNATPRLILVKVAPCKPPSLIAGNEFIDLIGLQRPEAVQKLLDELTSEQARLARDQVEQINRSRAAPDITNVTGTPNPQFTGRGAEITLLHNQIKSGTTTAITAVHGMGGIGKTTLAREYALRYGTGARFAGVWWINAETTSGILSGYDQLAERLGNAFARDRDQENTANRLRDWLASQPDNAPWLLVFDNAPDAETVAPWLPAGSAKVVITSRYNDFDTIATSMSLDFWDDDTTADFLLHRIGRGTRAEALSLATRLGGLPLAAEQAGAFLFSRRTLAYQIYEDRLIELLAHAPKKRPGGYEASLYATCAAAIEDIATRDHGDAAKGLLSLCAYLSPEGVDLSMLTGCAKQTEILQDPLRSTLADELTCADMIAALTSYSMIRISDVAGVGQTLILHRLLGEICRDLLPEEKQANWSASAVALIYTFMPHAAIEPRHWPLCARLAPHARTFLRLGPQPRPAGKVLGHVLNQAAVYLDARGDFDGAITLLRHLVEVSEVAFKDNPQEFAKVLSNLAGRMSERQANWEEAEQTYKKALAIQEDILPPNDPDIAATMSNYGTFMWRQKRYAEAEAPIQAAVDSAKAKFGSNSAIYAVRLNNLGTNYGDWAQAVGAGDLRRELLVKEGQAKTEAMQITRIQRGFRHPEMAARYNNLAVMFAARGDTPSTINQLEKAVAIQLSLDQLAHPNTRGAIAWLLDLYSRTNQTDKVERIKAGDVSDLNPIVEQIEAEHRTWVTKDPDNRHFGPPSPITDAIE